MNKQKKEPTSKAKKFWKITGIIFLIILLAGCLVVDGWFVYVALFAPAKTESKVFNIGDIETVDGSKYNVIEINYLKNENQNGYEMFEIKFTGLMDENKTSVYSQGLQFISNTTSDKITWVDYEDFYNHLPNTEEYGYDGYNGENLWYLGVKSFNKGNTGALWWYRTFYANYITPQANAKTTSVYNYGSADNFDTTMESSVYPIRNNPGLKIEIDGQIYLLELRGNDYISVSGLFDGDNVAYNDDGNYVYSNLRDCGDNYRWYVDYNYYTLAYELFNQVQAMANGTNQVVKVPFLDWFKFSKLDENGVYVAVTDVTETTKVKEFVQTNVGIKVNISANGATSANDSIFKAIHGSPNLDITGEGSNDYFYGRTVIDLDIYDFDLILVENNYYLFKFNQKFLDKYLSKKDLIVLRITIDENLLNEKGYKFAGFYKNEEFNSFVIYKTILPDYAIGGEANV